MDFQMAQGWPTAYQSVFGLKDGGAELMGLDGSMI